MIRKAILFASGFLGFAFCVASGYYGQNIPFIQQWPLFEALRNTASIIFAVVGAWLAIIYPERLKLSFGKGSKQDSNNGNVGLLLVPAVHSTIILVCLLLIGIAAPLLKQIPGILDNVAFLRGASFSILTTLTLWQVAIVVMTIIPADMVKTSVDNEISTKEILSSRDKLISSKADFKK